MKQLFIKIVKVYGVFFSTLLLIVVFAPVSALKVAVSVIRDMFDCIEDALNKLLDDMKP